MTSNLKRSSKFTRRNLLQGFSAAVALTPITRRAKAALPMVQASGYVFEDLNLNGQRAPDQAGLPGVMISNGRDVVLTDDTGRWSLVAKPGESIFVIKPSAWSVPIDAYGIPRASVRIPSEASLMANSIDFPLRRSPELKEFDVLLVADTQPSNQIELEYVHRTLLSGLNGKWVDFAIHHGDVVGDDLSLFGSYLETLRKTGITWYHCPGNHDADFNDRQKAFVQWNAHFDLTHYAFQYAGVTFILLNNVEPIDSVGGSRPYIGRVGTKQLDFVRNVLSHLPDDMLVVSSMHIPLLSFEDSRDPSDNTVDRDELLKILAKQRRSISFAGHSHTTEHHYLTQGCGHEAHHHQVLTALCGAWWGGEPDIHGIPTSDSRDGTPKGFHVLSIKGDNYCTKFHPCGITESRAIRVSTEIPPSIRPSTELASLSSSLLPLPESKPLLLVNVFDGGPQTDVTYRVEGLGNAPQKMERVARVDPYISALYSQDPTLWKSWVEPAPSSHIWSAPLPQEALIDGRRVIVSVIGEYGDIHNSEFTIRLDDVRRMGMLELAP
jgi:hypothetical protein